MAEQFKDQGGAATSDPSSVQRWLTSALMSRLFTTKRTGKRRAKAEQNRRKASRPHRIEYFHQVDDGYSHLTACLLKPLASRYDVEVICHLVQVPSGKNIAEPDLLARLSRYDAQLIAPGYGLDFPEHPQPPQPMLVALATQILAAQDHASFIDHSESVSRLLWLGDKQGLEELASTVGQLDRETGAAAVNAGNERRRELKHYLGAMFYYEGEWYWWIDRLHFLEQRLADLGLDTEAGTPIIAPKPAVDLGEKRDTGTLTLELFASLRSPYTAVIFDRAVDLATRTGVNLHVRPVLPMVMRGVPATREKGMYIFMDAAREAHDQGVPYGHFYDPIGEPARRCYSLYPWAREQGKDVALISSFLRHAFVLGVNTNNDAGLRKVVEAADLNWQDAKTHLDRDGWQEILEVNRQMMYQSGLWGVPSFRLLDAHGEEQLAVWGQDRLWVVARAINAKLSA